MLIYLLLIVLILLIGKITVTFSYGKYKYNKICDYNDNLSKKNDLKYFLWFCVLTLVSGLRGESVGVDTKGYITIFKAHNNLSSGNTDQEICFQYLCKLIGYFTDNPQWLLIVTSAMISGCVLFFIRRNSQNDTLSVFYYVALYFYFLAMNGMRQFVAIGIILVATEFAKKKKLIPFILLIILACGFHNTAILGVTVWWLFKPNATVKRMAVIAVIAGSAVIGFSVLQRFVLLYMPDYSLYISDSYGRASGIMMPVIYSIIFCVSAFVAYFDKEWQNNKFNMSFLCIAEVAMIWGLSPLFVTGISSNISQRIGWWFQIYSIVLIANLLESSLLKKNKSFFYILFVGVGLLHLVYFLSKGWHGVVPYYFFE